MRSWFFFTRIRDKYFHGYQRIVNKEDWDVFRTTECNDNDPNDEDKLKLSLSLFLEIIVLSRENTTVNHKHLSMANDLDYFSLIHEISCHIMLQSNYCVVLSTIKTHRELKNKSNSYSLVGFPFAFTVKLFNTI